MAPFRRFWSMIMEKVILEMGAYLRVPQDKIADYEAMQSELRINNKQYHTKREFGQVSANDIAYVDLWFEDQEGYVYVPRSYTPPLVAGVEYVFENANPTFDSSDEPWEFYGELREHQVPAAEALMERVGYDKMLCLGCGKGKTFMALWYSAQLRLPTLVVVDRNDLAEQWVERAVSCLGVSPDEIGRIQGNPDRWTVGSKLTIALIQTLTLHSSAIDDALVSRFGLVIVDECHIMAAPSFSRVLPLFPGERLGLTATWERLDGLHPVFMLHLGGLEPCYTDVSRDQPATWFFKELPRIADDSDCYRRVPGKTKTFRDRRGELQQTPLMALMLPKYVTKATLSELWNDMICADVIQAYAAGRNILVLGDRREHLANLCQRLGDYGVDVGLATGDVGKKDRKVSYNQRVILATWQLAGKGLDIDRLDTLFILVPYDDDGRLSQAKGRIDRVLYDGREKKAPFVIVYCHDAVPSLARTADRMRNSVRRIDPQAEIRRIRYGRAA